MQKVSFSQFRTSAECPRRWVLSSRYQPKLKAAALQEGEIWHAVLGKWYTEKRVEPGLDTLYALRNEFLENARQTGLEADKFFKLESKFAAMEQVLRSYWSSVAVCDFNEFEFEAIERSFEVPISRGVRLIGQLDGIWRHKQTGVRYIVEHKYQSDFHDELMPMDLQISIYTLAMIPEFGILPTLYNVARKPLHRRDHDESPEDFSSRVSKSVSSDTKDFRYDSLEFTSRRFIRRRYSRSRRELEVALDQVRSQSRFMRDLKRRPELAYRNVGDHCLWICPFKSICVDEDPIVVDRFFVKKQAHDGGACSV